MTGTTSPAKSPARSPKAVQGSSPRSPRSGLPPIKTSKPASRTASNLVSPKYGEGPLCHNPVSPRTPKEMTGSMTERSTGIIYPYNMWGPCNPTKYGHLQNTLPYPKEKEHYKGKHDKLEKDRLMKRKFGHIRHNCYYKNLMEPPTVESLSWLDPKRKEFWRTDVEKVLKRDEEKRRARQKELLGIWANEEAWRRHNLQKLRDVKYQAYLDLATNMAKYGCKPNISGAPHINIITRKPIGEHGLAMLDFQNEVAEYKRVARTLMLRERNSGARNFNILNWTKNPPGPKLPPWPEKPPPPPPPPPPDPRTPLHTSKGAISCGRVYGAFGTVNIP
ncbi:hypothetical protein M758_4G085100 [Ceratodon purpureus]|uniref:Uncharacterized protein n=1 Tax=Ceratodon purpureus TaxID=3225 RepID=A0A8T0I9T1_CERPU|nr:hypothetical protein KC19_4G084200 [Ceratodon purpureus]KAG0618688.1 hypothetical protein M758_4G085100 [Ceratodon purpureus]